MERDADGRDREPGDRQLDDRERRILDFEAEAWKHPGRKIEDIRDEFDMSATRYYRILGALIDTPAALRHDPMLVKRLLRQREAREAARARRTLTTLRPLG